MTITELIPHIDATYRTQACRTGRAIEGFSMGGYGAFKWGLQNPGLFSSAISYSGKFTILCADGVNGDLRTIIDDLAGPALDSGLQLRMTAGSNEEELYNEYVEYIGYLEDAGFEVEGEVITGIGHSIADSYELKGEDGLNFHCDIIGDASCPSLNVIPPDIKTHYSWGNLHFAKDGLIDIRLNDKSKVTMSLYNAKGRLMQLLIPEETKTKGLHKVQLKRKTLTPGAYVIYLSIAEKTYNFSLKIVE